MADLTDAEIDAAAERGRVARLAEPRAAAARYDRAGGRVIVELTNGCSFACPPGLVQGLTRASDGALADHDRVIPTRSWSASAYLPPRARCWARTASSSSGR